MTGVQTCALPIFATGATIEEVEQQLREAIEFHLEGMREDGIEVPQPISLVEYIDVAA